MDGLLIAASESVTAMGVICPDERALGQQMTVGAVII
jgi:hypothetical protein